MGYRYTYILMAAIFLIFWLSIFIWRKTNRKEMLTMSLILAIFGPISDILYTKDWWKPLTLTNTAIVLKRLLLVLPLVE